MVLLHPSSILTVMVKDQRSLSFNQPMALYLVDMHHILGVIVVVHGIKIAQHLYTQLPKAISAASRIMVTLFIAAATMDLYLEVEAISTLSIIAMRQTALVIQTHGHSLQVKATYLEINTSQLKKSRFIPSLSNSLIIGLLTNYSLNTIIRLKSH